MLKLKLYLKLILCSFFYYTGLLHLYIKWKFLKQKSFPAVIINYHRFVESYDDILEVHPSVTHSIRDFKKEIQFLKKYFDIRSLDNVIDGINEAIEFKRPTIAITIDDGYKDNFDLMFPVLKDEKLPVTIFLSTAVIGTNNMNWYDYCASMIMHTKNESLEMNGLCHGQTLKITTMEDKRAAYNRIIQELKEIDLKRRDRCIKEIETQLGPVTNTQPMMLSWDEIRTMSETNITFGAHTHTHPILTKMPLEDAQQDIGRSKQIIEKQLGKIVRHFAYPNGRKIDFNDDLRTYCQDIQFSSISTFEYGSNQCQDDIWALKRIGSEAPISIFAINVMRAFQTKG